ncbi:MAG: sigma-54-dependent Fis family transcriptional regulator [Bdellovibrionales bacterium]|nr:sigma-54-dependent Fis family transcriptional regulator [Bdellovibrionales bacterium]
MNAIPKARILVVDDDREMRSMVEDFLINEGFKVFAYGSAADALKDLSPDGRLALNEKDGDIDVIISDIKMPGIDGLEFTERLQTLRPEVPVILITAFGSIETAIEAMRKGAFHYVVKPFKLVEMSVNLDRAMEHRRLKRDNSVLRQEIQKSWNQMGMIGKSQAMTQIYDLVRRVAQTQANVLITGESGTGKEMVARGIHESGPRAKKPFVAINCSAIPDGLLESELFGHAKGSFTGATQKKKGLFEEAAGGTLFLDEIGDMNIQLQAKLLRVIQERKIRPVGETQSKDIDLRIIAATHKDLKTAVQAGHFREDLFYRLSVIPVVIPPLRQRKEDIPLLAENFIKKFSAANQLQPRALTQRAMRKLLDHSWHGNVRELENVIERAVVLSSSTTIDEKDIPLQEPIPAEVTNQETPNELMTIMELEKRYIRNVLEKTGGRKDQAAQILGINRRTLYRKEREYGWVEDDGRD